MKSKFFSEFKEFAMRGNVIDLAVGVVIGGAFGKIVSSVVSDIIMPPIGLLIGGINFTDLKITLKHATESAAGEAMPAVAINIGNFLQATIDFLIIAFAIFLFVRLINGMSRKQKEAEAAKPAEPAADIKLLTEIRDLLKKDNKK